MMEDLQDGTNDSGEGLSLTCDLPYTVNLTADAVGSRVGELREWGNVGQWVLSRRHTILPTAATILRQIQQVLSTESITETPSQHA